MARRILLSIFILLILTTLPALAKGWPAKMVITGPGLPGEIEITDPALVEVLSNYFVVSDAVPRPGVTSPVYEITIYLSSEKGGGEIVEFIHYRYFPNPSGGRGYILYAEGMILVDGRDVGDWFYAREEWEVAMQQIIANSSAPSSTSPSPLQLPFPIEPTIWLAIALAFSGLAAGVWYLKHKQATG
ncbi:MAG: hypothetical protein HYX86_00525 [Chloroflexi bacterium]|nr:hypothetical protein [Chloroflexota bacterium]